jgi:hypothetical protein
VTELTNDLDAHDDVAIDVKSDRQESSFRTLSTVEKEMVVAIPEAWKTPQSILCIPGLGKLDEAAALVLAQLLRRRGYGASAEKADALSMSKFFSLDLSGTSLICICYVERPSSAKINYAVRRLRKKHSTAAIILAFLGETEGTSVEALSGAAVVQGPFKVVLEAIVEAAYSFSERGFAPKQDLHAGSPEFNA